MQYFVVRVAGDSRVTVTPAPVDPNIAKQQCSFDHVVLQSIVAHFVQYHDHIVKLSLDCRRVLDGSETASRRPRRYGCLMTPTLSECRSSVGAIPRLRVASHIEHVLLHIRGTKYICV